MPKKMIYLNIPYSELKKLEWSGYKYVQGSTMGNDDILLGCCPVCKEECNEITTNLGECQIIYRKSLPGHKSNCWLNNILNQ